MIRRMKAIVLALIQPSKVYASGDFLLLLKNMHYLRVFYTVVSLLLRQSSEVKIIDSYERFTLRGICTSYINFISEAICQIPILVSNSLIFQ